MLKRIAFYGKGGIGKSTISSNISAIYGFQNKKVLQIGCDPKHDSCLLLMQKTIDPILDNHKIDFSNKSNIIHEGIYGVNCIEIGGPEPGIGCAGRGILKGIDIIDNLLIGRMVSESVEPDVMNDWEGQLLEDAYKVLRDSLVELAVFIDEYASLTR